MTRRIATQLLLWICLIATIHQCCAASATLNEIQSISAAGNISDVLYSGQYGLLFLRDSSSDIRVVNATTGAQIGLQSPSATGSFTDFTLSPSGRYLYAADYGGTNIGYNTPAHPSFVDRYDLQTATWTSAPAPSIAYRISAVDDNRVLLLGQDQSVDLTLDSYVPGAMSKLTQTLAYEGDITYSPSLSRVFYNLTGLSSTDARAYALSGNTLSVQESVPGVSYFSSGALSSDGLTYYYNQVALHAADLTKSIATFSEGIGAAAPNMAFGTSHYFDPTTGAVLGAVPFTPLTWTVDANGHDVWAVEQTSGSVTTLHHYVIARSSMWNVAGSGSWANTANWSPNTLPDGIDNTADLSQVTLTADAVIALDGNHTIGHLIIGDVGASRNWTIAPGSGGILKLQVSGGSPTVTATNQTTTINAPIDGNQGLLKDGAGTLILGAVNTYTGDTTINGGALIVSADSNFSSGSLAIGAAMFRAAGSLSSPRAIGLQNAASTIQVDGAFTYTALSGATLSGAGGLTKTGPGTLDLFAATGNYGGATSVNAGTLNLPTLTSASQVTIASGAALNVSGADLSLGSVTNSGNLNFTSASGTITLASLNGNGTSSFSGGATFPTLSTGSISVAGTANITTASGGAANFSGPNAAIGTLSNSAVTLANGAMLSVAVGTQTAGGISGQGSLAKTTTGILIFGADNTYTGGTNISAGTVQVGNGSTTGSLAGNVADNAALIFNRTDSYTFGGAISGSGIVRQSGTGTLSLSGNNSYAGITTISSGTLMVSSDNNLGSGALAISASTFRVAGNMASSRNITMQSTAPTIQIDSDFTYAALSGATIAGSTLTKTGTGTLDLSAATVSYTGTTTVSAGALTLAAPATTAQLTVASGATLNVSSAGLTLGSLADSGTANLTNTTGAITLSALSGTGTTNFAGGATFPTLSTGAISVAGPANITTASGGSANFSGPTATIATLSNTAVNLASGTTLSVGAGTQTGGGISGAGSVTKTGTGTFILGTDNTYSGGTTISSGTFQVGNAGTTGSIVGNVFDNGTLYFNRSDAFTFGGLISGTGVLQKGGAGAFTLTNANTYLGGTTISAGSLQLGNGSIAGSILGNVANSGSLVFNTLAAGQTFGGIISGTGSVVKLGPGTQILTAANTNTGGTTISAGTLQIGSGGTTGTFTGSVTNNAALVFKRSDSITFTGAITGAGRLEQAGSGTLTLNSSASNDLTISSGRVVVGSASTLTGNVTISATGRLDNNNGGKLHIANLDNAGVLSGAAEFSGTFLNRATGDVRLDAGQDILVQNTSANSNAGIIEVLGNPTTQATFESLGSMTNAGGGTSLIVARNADLRFDGGLTNQGAIAMNFGLSDVFGTVNNAVGGSITISGGAGVTFYNDVVQNGNMIVSATGGSSAVFLGAVSGAGGATGGGNIFFLGDVRPGNSPASVTFDNSVTFTNGALDLEIGGATLGSQYDHIKVTGNLALGGTLNVSLINSFAPTAGQAFDVLDWSTLTGTFSAIQLPALPNGLAWNTAQLYANGSLSVLFAGDYNGDGRVDAADYVVWRSGLGTTYTQNDYDVWRTNFGRTSGNGTGATVNGSVPEPQSVLLLIAGMLAICSRSSAVCRKFVCA